MSKTNNSKLLFTTVYIGKFMIDEYFLICTLQPRKICVTTQVLKVKLHAINIMFLIGANTDFTAISVCLFVCLYFSIFNNLL